MPACQIEYRSAASTVSRRPRPSPPPNPETTNRNFLRSARGQPNLGERKYLSDRDRRARFATPVDRCQIAKKPRAESGLAPLTRLGLRSGARPETARAAILRQGPP